MESHLQAIPLQEKKFHYICKFKKAILKNNCKINHINHLGYLISDNIQVSSYTFRTQIFLKYSTRGGDVF